MFGANRFYVLGLLKDVVLRLPVTARCYYRIKGIDSFSARRFDRKIENLVSPTNGFYVELGADNGIYESNSRYWEVFRGYKGVLIEPNPHTFKKCKAVRSGKNYFANVACVDSDYKSKTTKILLAGAMSVSWDLDSDLTDKLNHISIGSKHQEKHSKLKSSKVMWIEVQVKTLNQILVESNAPRVIDFLSLDVEGAENTVLKGVDHSKYRFRCIIIESRNHERTRNLLEGVGYKLVEVLSPTDLLFSDLQSN
jgi:FkbM family methyltransferase